MSAVEAVQVRPMFPVCQCMLMESQKALESVILNPKNADYLAIVKAARNGAVYGAKVRFPHALV